MFYSSVRVCVRVCVILVLDILYLHSRYTHVAIFDDVGFVVYNLTHFRRCATWTHNEVVVERHADTDVCVNVCWL